VLLSIVIPSRNRPDLLAACLASVRRHAPPGAEVLVVDDDSPGAVASAVARSADAKWLRLPRRGGFCVAANAGIGQAAGDVVEVLNDDVEVSRNWAEAALERFRDPAVGAVTPLVLLGPPGANPTERIDSAGDEYLFGGVARKRWHGEALTERHLVAGPVFGANGAGSFYRRAALLEAGGFPEEFVAYFDDVDLSWRLKRAGWRVWYEPASRMHHRVSSSYGRPAGDLLALQSRNEELLFWRNLAGWRRLAELPLHLAVVAAKAVRRLREGRLRPFLRGKAQALRLTWGAGPAAR
jgi:GT2 family glycosyltransferase